MGDYEHEVLIWSRPRWRFAFFFAMEKEGRRPQAAKSPVPPETARRVVAPYGVNGNRAGGEIPHEKNHPAAR